MFSSSLQLQLEQVRAGWRRVRTCRVAGPRRTSLCRACGTQRAFQLGGVLPVQKEEADLCGSCSPTFSQIFTNVQRCQNSLEYVWPCCHSSGPVEQQERRSVRVEVASCALLTCRVRSTPCGSLRFGTRTTSLPKYTYLQCGPSVNRIPRDLYNWLGCESPGIRRSGQTGTYRELALLR